MPQTSFRNNHQGILNHDGSLKVESHDVLQRIIAVYGEEIHVQNSKGNKYIPEIHRKLDLTFCEVGDTAFIKFYGSRPVMVGYRKEMKQ